MPHASCHIPHAAYFGVLPFVRLAVAAIFCCLYCRHSQEMPEKWQQFICSSANLVKLSAGGNCSCLGGEGGGGHKPVSVCALL